MRHILEYKLLLTNTLYNLLIFSIPKTIFCPMAGWLANCSWQAGWLADCLLNRMSTLSSPGRHIVAKGGTTVSRLPFGQMYLPQMRLWAKFAFGQLSG